MNASFGKSQTVSRVEDTRLLTGHGRYLDDTAPKQALRAHFLRAEVAHAEIASLDLATARAAAGVHLVLTAEDMEAAGMDIAMKGTTVTNADGSRAAAPMRPMLAKGRVRYVGEPVVLIVADTLEQARDAAELIAPDYKALPAHVDPQPGGPQIHPEAPENVAYDFQVGDPDEVESAFADAAHRVEITLEDNRIIVNSMEPRGSWAEWQGGRLHLCLGSQGVWGPKTQLMKAFGLPEDKVHVTTPDVGGGFGMKGFMYPEYFAVAEAARRLERPVHWMSGRTEAMLSDNGGRDLVTKAEMAFDADHRLLGYRVDVVSNLGAYNSNFGQAIQSQLFSKVMTGTYHIPQTHLRARGVYTNTVQMDAYRGAGRPEAIYTLERTMDHAARELGVDPWTLRRKNFIAPDAFPYRTQVGELYDVGAFAEVLDHAHEEADADGFAARRADSEARGKLRGLGLSYYIEAILGDPTEGATVAFNDDGTASLFVGTQSNGQGHETVYAQFLSDRTGIPLESIHVVQGDSDLIAKGGGTGGSRSVTVQSAATIATVERMISAFAPFLAGELDVAPDAVSFDEGAFRAEGSNRTLTMLEAAELARQRGRDDLLRHHAETTLDGRSYPNGAHVAEVEIDPETGKLRLDRYTVVDDLGNLLHPQLAEGQIHGGVAQGFGQAVTEHVAHDESGQLLTATFMDYAMPRADDLPPIRFVSHPVPSTANPLGMKGCGEAGTVGALAAIANAARDALAAEGVARVDMPLTPDRVWSWIQSARAGR
ncbi:xanthine dehydrogenase [Rhodobacteraceae bacterium WD3A24]|nr:xanthine dehydrogenase [Rhodobacteraceae bacterium WD3A24]